MSNKVQLKNLKRKFAFTLVELIITIGIISLLAGIIIVVINPNSIYQNSRNTQRTNDITVLQASINKYLLDVNTTGVQRSINDIAGFRSLLTSAINNSGGNCDNAVNNGVTSPISGAFNIDITTSANNINITPLITNGYIQKLPKEPDNSNYKACIDVQNGNQFIIYSEKTENKSTLISTIIGQFASPGPVAYYTFEEGSGTTAIDSSGSNFNLTWHGTGSSHYVTGKHGLGANLNGVDDYLSLANAVTTSTNFTITAWIMAAYLPEAKVVSGNYPPAVIAYNGDDGAGNSLGGYGITIGDGSGGNGSKVAGLMGSVQWNNTNYIISSGSWYHIAYTYASSNIKIYIRDSSGNLLQTYSTTGSAPRTPNPYFSIGNEYWQNGTIQQYRYFGGVIDDVKVYDYARTASQIALDI